MGAGGVSDLGPSEFLGFATVLRETMSKSRDACAKEWPKSFEILVSANEVVLACIGSILARPDRSFPEERVAEKVRRATVHSALLQGIHAVEYCITNGIYAQASALVRMEIEGVECLRGLRQGVQRDGATPRLLALKHLGRTYRQLTGLAHLSTHDLLTHVVNPQIGNTDHSFNAQFARHLLGTHLCALAAFALDLSEFRPFNDQVRLTEVENGYLSAMFGVLVAEKFIQLN